MAEHTGGLTFHVRRVFATVAQSRVSLNIWPWNVVWNSAKYSALPTWGQNNKSKPLSHLALMNEVMFIDGAEDPKPSRSTTGLLENECTWNTLKELLECLLTTSVLVVLVVNTLGE
jgi:hypothetical protein